MQIKSEILRLLDGSTSELNNNYKLLIAENAAIGQIRNWIGNKVDCNIEFAKQDDARDQFLVMTTIDITLYHLYSQTGHKDIPDHRQARYDDAVQWLKDVGRGDVDSTLTRLPDDTYKSDFRVNSREVDDMEW